MLSQTPEVIIISEATFKSNPPKAFLAKCAGGFSLPDSSVVTVVSDRAEFSNWPKTSFVTSLGELDELRTRMVCRPLVLSVTCGKHVPRGQRLNKYGDYLSMRDPEWWLTTNSPWMHPYRGQNETSVGRTRFEDRYIMPRFVASVDTVNPNVRAQLNEGFDSAENMLRAGKAFAIEFNFNPMIVSWWRQQGARRYDTMECLEMTVATGASFTITNHGPLNHCFDCQFIWCACWPCYCLSAVPYKIWRNFIQGVHDVEVEIHGHVTTAFPSSSGYDLFELHLGSSLHAGTEELMPSAPPLPHGIFDQPFHQGNVGGVFM